MIVLSDLSINFNAKQREYKNITMEPDEKLAIIAKARFKHRIVIPLLSVKGHITQCLNLIHVNLYQEKVFETLSRIFESCPSDRSSKF